MPDNTDALGARFRDPCLTLAAEHLTHIGVFAIARKALELLGCGIKAHDRIGRPLREPDFVVGIDPHGVGARLRAWKLPLLPTLVAWIIDTDVAGVPLTDPQPAFRIRPHATRALILGRRLINGRSTGLQFDIGEIIARQRYEPDIALGCAGDAIGPATLGRVPDLHVACRRVESAIDAVLSREPDATAAIESRGVEIGVGHALVRQPPYLDLLRRWIDAHDGVLTAVGKPRSAVRPHDDTVRCRVLAELNTLDLAASWIQSAGNAKVLASVPNISARPDGHIVRIVAFRQLVVLGLLSESRRRGRCQNSQRHEQATHDSLHFRKRGWTIAQLATELGYDDEFPVLDVVPERGQAAHPHALLLGGCDLVTDALAGVVLRALELLEIVEKGTRRA